MGLVIFIQRGGRGMRLVRGRFGLGEGGEKFFVMFVCD